MERVKVMPRLLQHMNVQAGKRPAFTRELIAKLFEDNSDGFKELSVVPIEEGMFIKQS